MSTEPAMMFVIEVGKRHVGGVLDGLVTTDTVRGYEREVKWYADRVATGKPVEKVGSSGSYVVVSADVVNVITVDEYVASFAA